MFNVISSARKLTNYSSNRVLSSARDNTWKLKHDSSRQPVGREYRKMSVKVEKITEPLLLGEGPHWDAAQQALYFVSIHEHTIHKYVPATGTHTRTKLAGRVGFIVPVEGARDQFVVGVERRVLLLQWDGADGSAARELRTLAEVDRQQPATRLNDGKADPRGRLFAGTMGKEDPPGQFVMEQGSFYRLDERGLVTMCDRIHLSNGLAWDQARKTMYYIDSLEYNIRKYDYDIDTGEMSNKTYICDFKKNNMEGIPDGMTLDTSGNLWVAVFDSSSVINVDPATGQVLRRIPIPAHQVTSLTFGGDRYDTLFVTTASMNIGGEQPPPCGATFQVTGLGVKGFPNVSFKLPK